MKKQAETLPIWDFRLVRELRKREKMSLEQLSERSGVSVSVISSDSSATPSSPSQLEWMIGLPWPNTRGSLKSPS